MSHLIDSINSIYMNLTYELECKLTFPLQRTSVAPNCLLGKFQICQNSLLYDLTPAHFLTSLLFCI